MKTDFNGHLCIVFALEHYNPLNMIRALGENGINPVYISVKRRYEVATKSKYISSLHQVDSVEDGFKLLLDTYGGIATETGKKPYIVFSDDKSVGYFDLHYDEWKDKFITYNAGRNGRINEFMDKYNIQQLAKKHGFNVLDSYVISKDDELPEGLWYPIITKDISPNSGSWKADVYICQDEQELKEAIKKIESPLIMIQHFVDKQNEMALEGYTINKGKDMQIITQMTWKYLIQGYYSPYHDVCMFTDKEIEAKLKAMFEEIGFEGVFEVEFLIDKDGTFYFMETNFRASAWNPTCKFAGMPLPYLWIKGMENGYIDPSDRKEFDPFTSMSEVIDYAKRVEGGMVSIAEWLRDFKDAKCVYIYDKNDRGPWDEVVKNWDNFKYIIMQKILFTGGTGFLGKNIMPILLKQYNVTTIGITQNDMINVNLAKEIPELQEKYDIILHAAGKAHVYPKTEEERQAFFDVNYQGTVNLCKALERSSLPTAIVFISTMNVYGSEPGNMDTEDSRPLVGDSPYAESKIMAEHFLTDWCKEHNVTLGILRPGLIAGENAPGNLGAMVRGIRSGAYLSIAHGKARKSMLMAEDIARLVPLVAEKGGTYNVCDSYNPSFGELEALIAKQLGKKSPMSIPYWVAKCLAWVGDVLGSWFQINSSLLE